MRRNSGRNQTFGGLSKAAKRGTDKIMNPHDTKKRLPDHRNFSDSAVVVHQNEIRILLWRFYKAGTQTPITQHFFQIFREQIARKIEFTGAKSGRNSCCALSCAVFNAVEQ